MAAIIWIQQAASTYVATLASLRGAWWMLVMKGVLTDTVMDRLEYYDPARGDSLLSGLCVHFLLAFGGGTCVGRGCDLSWGASRGLANPCPLGMPGKPS
jgi:hypothetical protein